MPMSMEAHFLDDVAHHTLTVLADQGLYRHLRFRREQSIIMGFDLITWPGHLCYTGDMGTYVFARVPDMFTFFRTDPDRTLPAGQTLEINLGYWAEKCLADDRHAGITEYQPAVAKTVLLEWLKDCDASPAVRRSVEEEIFSALDDGEPEVRRLVADFSHDGFEFTDFSEATLQDYTQGFRWCCYAIAWGVAQYDRRPFSSPTVPIPAS